MKACNYRLLLTACFPLALPACVAETVPTDQSGETGESGNQTSSFTTTATTDDPPDTTTDEPPDTTSGTATSTSGPSTTAMTDPDTGESDLASGGDVEVCNNNMLEGGEVCDLNQLNGETCASLGYEGGVLGCLLDCTAYNLLGCFICGNEVIDLAEDCEGEFVPKEVTCQSLGYEAGWVTCGEDCQYDLSECSICGDGIQAGPEDCDGIDFGGENCVSQGFMGGNLGCNLAQCAFVTSGCTP
jgi:hypothetical protein